MTMKEAVNVTLRGSPSIGHVAFGMHTSGFDKIHVVADLRTVTILLRSGRGGGRADLSADECFHRIIDAQLCSPALGKRTCSWWIVRTVHSK